MVVVYGTIVSYSTVQIVGDGAIGVVFNVTIVGDVTLVCYCAMVVGYVTIIGQDVRGVYCTSHVVVNSTIVDHGINVIEDSSVVDGSTCVVGDHTAGYFVNTSAVVNYTIVGNISLLLDDGTFVFDGACIGHIAAILIIKVTIVDELSKIVESPIKKVLEKAVVDDSTIVCDGTLCVD